ncbi:hypothetical protein ACYSNU_00435 [Enterococcus sp. LJL120]
MKKELGVTFIAGLAILAVATPVHADETTLSTQDGTTQLRITDFAVDPETGLPLSPGAFNLVEVSSIDFGEHTLDSLAGVNPTFTGTYDQDMTVKDARPSAASIVSAKAKIAEVAADVEKTATDDEIAAATAEWDAAIAASAWRVEAEATTLDGIGSSLKIGTTEVLTAAGTVITEEATIPVGTKAYTLETPELTLATNNIEAKTYNGTITYTAINAI